MKYFVHNSFEVSSLSMNPLNAKLYTSFSNALVIDDDVVDSLITKIVLTKSGFAKNVIVYNSIPAVSEYLGVVSSEEYPQSVILDMDMSYQKGFDFLCFLENYPSFLKENGYLYVLSSSFTMMDTKRLYRFSRVCKFLQKPMTRQLVWKLMDSLES
ncbi:hypothetical protein [Xanthocytophaga agilis]|uniref:Response regulatory domain-containing protein n=1 Tax=Xanthocytophaga agilis TaxID=3048010 RepID=A0AAE3RC83_9BACT|nr:hypothetical protein [Xanthocytophaga agilis]MDJ1504878.1 hypothetical protein [Xanthocytophaga agilis]